MATRVERAKRRKHRTLKAIVTILVLGIVALSLTGYIYASNLVENEFIHKGISVNGLQLGGMTKGEARQKLEETHSQKLSETKVKLLYEDYSKEISYSDIGVDYDYSASVDRAFEWGRSGNFFKKTADIIEAKKNGKNLEIAMMRNDNHINRLAEEVKLELDREPVDASIDFSSGVVSVVPEQNGQTVNTDLLRERIIESIGTGGEVQMPVELEAPNIKASELERIKRQIGSYSTSFSSGDLGRNHNILLSSNSIDGELIMPGEVFSFNDATGLRDRANGYRESIVIVNKKPVLGIGGGVCQTSSTLYNALASTGIEIVERHNHSLPVGYVPRGQDATVADYSLDFRFRNNFDYPIFIKSEIVGNTVQIRIYGE